MSDNETVTGENEAITAMAELLETVKEDAPKGLSGNKQAARRARKALNELKKLCTPLRQQIQDAVTNKED